MNKSWLLLVPLVVGCDLAAAPSNERTNLRSYEKIHFGMSKEQVREIMGAWPGEKEVTPKTLGTREVFIYYGPDDEVLRIGLIPVARQKHVVNKKEFYVEGKLVKSESTSDELAIEQRAAGASSPEARPREETAAQQSVAEPPATAEAAAGESVADDPFAAEDIVEESVVDDPFAAHSIEDVADQTDVELDAAAAGPESEAEPQGQPYPDDKPRPENEPNAESEPTPEAEPAPEYRTWSDSTGKYRVEAELLSYGAGKARLKKRTGELIELPIEKLSEDDRKYIRSKLR